MTDKEKKAMEILKSKRASEQLLISGKMCVDILLNLIEKQQKELEQYKRLAEMNLKDSEEFKENMCEHRCILNNQIMELTEELNNLKEIEKSHQEENEKLRVELTKQQKIINQMAEDRMLPHGCRFLYNVFNKQDVIDFYKKFVEENE